MLAALAAGHGVEPASTITSGPPVMLVTGDKRYLVSADKPGLQTPLQNLERCAGASLTTPPLPH